MQKKKPKDEYWLNHKKAWQDSGLSQRNYSKQEGLCNRRLNYHINRLNKLETNQGLSFIKAPNFLKKSLEIKNLDGLNIKFPNGVVINLTLSTKLTLLQVIEAVGVIPC